MTDMNMPQVMVMTGAREGDDEIIEKNKLDKTGFAKNNEEINNKNENKTEGVKNAENKRDRFRRKGNNSNTSIKRKDSNDKVLTKIYTSDHVPKNGPQNYNNRSLAIAGFVNAMYDGDKRYTKK